LNTHKFQELKVWQKAHELVLQVYRVTRSFPPDERYGLVSQMRRAAVSVPANIAEGFSRRGTREKLNFYNFAQASLEELKYYFILAKHLEYFESNDDLISLAEEVSRMLYGWTKPLRNS
jgi:four helix bundle protein